MADKTRVKVGSNPSVQVAESTTIVKKVVIGTPIRAVDAARFDATTLDGESASYYLNADNFINLPNGLQNIRDIDSGVAITGITRIEGTIVPSEDRRYNLGTPTKRFGSIYLEGETLYVGNLSVSDAGDGKMQTAEANFTGDVDSNGNPIAELSNIKVVSTLDSAQVIDMINRWVRDTDGDSNGGPGLDSYFDSAYVQARVDTEFLDDLIDSDFINRNLDKIQIEDIIADTVDSAFVDLLQNPAGIKWSTSGNNSQFRTATSYLDSDRTEYTIRSSSFQNNLLQLELASFTPTVSVSGQSLNWDVPASSFSVTVDNPTDFANRYIASVGSITETGGDVHETLSDFTTSGPSQTPAGGVDWNQTFSTNSTAYIRSTSTTITGGSASASVTFLEDDNSTFSTVSFTTNWTTPNVSISMSNLSGNIFLDPYESTSYNVSVSGFSNSSNYANTVTPTGGTVSNSSGSGTFTFTDPIHQDNTGSRTLSVSSQMTRPAGVTGTEYTVTDTASDTSLSTSWTFPSISIFTNSVNTSPTNSDIVNGTSFTSDVTQYSNQTRTFSGTVNNSQSTPQAFWFGVRSSATQPSTFKTGASSSLLSDVTPTEVTVNLNNTYTDEDYDFYGLTLQPGNTYVSIS